MLTITPEFDPDVTEYTAATTNATNKITATAEDPDAAVIIASDEATIAADGTATWYVDPELGEGENIVTITVSNGEGDDAVEEVYTVTVTAS